MQAYEQSGLEECSHNICLLCSLRKWDEGSNENDMASHTSPFLPMGDTMRSVAISSHSLISWLVRGIMCVGIYVESGMRKVQRRWLTQL